MASHLDLEEQEQLDQLKHYWKQYGNLVTWLLILVLAAYAGWNGYQYWQRRQALQAAALYDEIERQPAYSDRVSQAWTDLQARQGSSLYATQAGLLVAERALTAGKPEAARQALGWVAAQGYDDGYRAIAQLRLAAVLLDADALDEALKALAGPFPKSMAALAEDRRGDIQMRQGQREQALASYTRAYQGMEAGAEYRRLVEVKLNALGADARQLPAVAAERAS